MLRNGSNMNPNDPNLSPVPPTPQQPNTQNPAGQLIGQPITVPQSVFVEGRKSNKPVLFLVIGVVVAFVAVVAILIAAGVSSAKEDGSLGKSDTFPVQHDQAMVNLLSEVGVSSSDLAEVSILPPASSAADLEVVQLQIQLSRAHFGGLLG
jgi:hypothetical protein